MHGIGSGAGSAPERSRHCGLKNQSHRERLVWALEGTGRHAELVIVHQSVSLCTATIQGAEGGMGPHRVKLGQDFNNGPAPRK